MSDNQWITIFDIDTSEKFQFSVDYFSEQNFDPSTPLMNASLFDYVKMIDKKIDELSYNSKFSKSNLRTKLDYIVYYFKSTYNSCYKFVIDKCETSHCSVIKSSFDYIYHGYSLSYMPSSYSISSYNLEVLMKNFITLLDSLLFDKLICCDPVYSFYTNQFKNSLSGSFYGPLLMYVPDNILSFSNTKNGVALAFYYEIYTFFYE